MQSRYDAVIVGAGPSGSIAAYEIAAAGYHVLLLEKHAQPGRPLCCAEGVSRAPLESLLTPAKEWICTAIDCIRVTGPNGGSVEVFHEKAGYVLDRKKFDLDLAQRAVRAGAVLECNAIGLELERDEDLFGSIKVLRSSGEISTIKASIFIAADGVESKIARLAGISNLVEINEVESLLQYRVDGVAVASNTIEFFIGNRIAPKGYIWIFPKSDSSANVGLGITVDSNRSGELERRLTYFISERFGRCKIIEKTGGMVPKYQGKATFRSSNLLVVGDAARALDSLSGAGIINAMMSGTYAGQAAVKYLSDPTNDIDRIDDLYPGRFLAAKEEELTLYRKLKNVYDRLDDDDFNDVIRALNDYFRERSPHGIKAGRLLAGLVTTRPRLLRLVRHLV
jgi:digeranylgeranylglycerophospholipid reductase